MRLPTLMAGALPYATILACTPAFAGPDEERDPDRDRNEITITGVRQSYRGDFALREIPQAIATIDDTVIEQNNVLRLTDALDLNASVARQNSLGGLWDSFAVRGFAGDENLPSGYLVNGFNAGRGFGGQRDVAGIERVEVLKGPAAAVLGRGEPGGSINLVTKQAELGRTFGTAALQYRSFDTVRTEGDANVALTDNLTARLIGYAEDGDTFRDTVHQHRWGFLPSIGIGLGEATRLTYDFEWTRVAVPFDRGIVVLNDDFRTVPRSRFLGEPSDGDTVARATGHQLRLQHDLSDRWSLLVGASHRDTLLTGFSSDAETARARQKLYVDGRSLSRQRRSRRYTSEHSVFRAELSGEFQTGSLRHRILIGGDFDYFDTDQLFTRYRGPVVTPTTLDRVRLIDPAVQQAQDGRVPLKAGFAHENVTTTLPAGTIRVPSDQPLGLLAAALLEPEAPDSFLAWGFFPEMLSNPPGAEDFVRAPLAETLLASDARIRAAFEAKLAADPNFAADGDARLDWLTARLPDSRACHLSYPVLRER